MTKKLQKNLQDPKKSSIFAADISKMVFEKCSEVPCDVWKPKEAMSIREMLIRSERGQRLDVHSRFRAEGIPDNMYMAEFEDVRLPNGEIVKQMKPDKLEDTFDHTPPEGVVDIVDVLRLQEETNARKEELRKRRSKKPIANADPTDPKQDPDPKNIPGPQDPPKQDPKD